MNFEELKVYCKQNKRVCPQPNYWNEIWNKLKGKQRINGNWNPSLPLILAAWWDTPTVSKQIRFFEHLEWAEKQGQLDEIAAYIESLEEEQWFHSND